MPLVYCTLLTEDSQFVTTNQGIFRKSKSLPPLVHHMPKFSQGGYRVVSVQCYVSAHPSATRPIITSLSSAGVSQVSSEFLMGQLCAQRGLNLLSGSFMHISPVEKTVRVQSSDGQSHVLDLSGLTKAQRAELSSVRMGMPCAFVVDENMLVQFFCVNQGEIVNYPVFRPRSSAVTSDVPF